MARALAGLAALAIAAFAVYRIQQAHPEQATAGTPNAVPPLGVSAAVVQRRDLPLTFDAVGRAEAKASVQVKSRVDGQVAELAFQEGRAVHKGQLLFRLDPAVLDAQARQAEGVLARDQAQLAKVRSDDQRNQALARQGFISPSGLAQTQAELQAAQATLNADRAALDNARLQVGYSRITAPVDGIAGVAQLPIGGAAKANDTTLVVINQVQPIYVSFAVPEPRLGELKTAMQRGTVHVTALVTGDNHRIEGTLAFIDNAVDPTTGSITAKALFDNRDLALTPGQFAQATVHVGLLQQVMTVPSVAVESGVDGPYTFVVLPDSTVGIRKLKVGVQSDGQTVVTSGLAEGERVVTSGQARLRDKSPVSIVPAAADGTQQ